MSSEQNINPQSEIRSPQSLWLVRHGQSTANLARQKAVTENLLTIDFPEREQNVPLSAFGEQQAAKLGEWFQKETEKPSVVFSSPFLRAGETTRLILENAGLGETEIFYDERLRERELGVFDRLTSLGVAEKFPAEFAARQKVGKFYFRPANGENWADVALRIRSFWNEIKTDFAGENVLVVSHEAVLHLFRYIVERMTEEAILEIDRAADIANCSITSYNLEAKTGKMILQRENFCIV
ncbi:MAG TPA: histidine phosphatase family protein [Pyrinomonadaceae bacterium]|jgi:broad specificity phosphatase PhoE